MSELQLLDQLKGPWDHLLILTAGIDLPFFEQTVLHELPVRCRNRIVLGDGSHVLDVYTLHAHDGLARTINQRYVAEGIFAPRAAHARLILLVHPDQGRLLVGSGNLSWQGYASGGELFSTYAYQAEAPGQLAAFVTVRELLEELMRRHYLSETAERYVQLMLQATPWLYQAPATADRPLRHNLNRSLLQQLRQAVGDDPVEELIILSACYDQECRALEQLLALLRPAVLTLLVQPGSTSVDPDALQRVLAGYGGQSRVHPVQRADGEAYLHAALILVKQRKRAVCMQGSANLAEEAMLLIDPQGTLELVNLLEGDRAAFDDLLAGLLLDPPPADLQSLGVRYEAGEPAPQQPATWQLTAAAWNGARLRVEDRGARPDLGGAVAFLEQTAHPIEHPRVDPRALEWAPPAAEASHFDRPVALRILLADGSASNPVFVCNTAALDATLAVTAEDEILSRVGGLDLDDRELESLIGLLGGTLLIDRRSLWQATGKQLPAAGVSDDEAPHLSYAEIDVARLRQHPRVQQYLRGAGAARAGRSRLQIILSAIADHQQEIVERASRASTPAAAGIASTDLSEEELEAEGEAAASHRAHVRRQRLQRLLKSFIHRYLEGVASPEFRALLGVETLVQNYIILSHLLWRLWLKEWGEHDVLFEAFVAAWHSFWGDAESPGCLGEASPAERGAVDALLHEHHAVATLLAGLYDSAHWVRSWGWYTQRIALRDFWRAFLARHATRVTPTVLERAWSIIADAYRHATPPPVNVIDELTELADFETTSSFLRELERRHGLPAGSCQIERVEVYREPLGQTTSVECLVISTADALRSAETTTALISAWMGFKRLDYYRIAVPTSHRAERVALYEVSEQEGILWDSVTRSEIALGPIAPEMKPWAAALTRLRTTAAQVPTPMRTGQAIAR